jgi:hypothetical protein
MTDVIVKLTKPVVAHGEEITQLVLREPETKDVMEIGYPYLIVTGDDKTEAVELRPKIVARYAVKLAKVPLSSVEKLAIADLQSLQAAVMSFFGQTPDTTSSDSSSESST